MCMKNFIVTDDDKAKLAEMTSKKEKAGYIWDYFKFWIIGAVVVVGLLVYFAVVIATRGEDDVLNVVFVNNYDNISDSSDFSRSFIEYTGDESLEGRVTFDNNAFFNLAKASDVKNDYYLKVLAYLEGGATQAVVCQYDNLMGLAKSGRILDLSDERVSSIYEAYKDRLVYYESEDGKIPVGIDISDGIGKSGLTEYDDGKAYICLSASADDYSMVETFIEFMTGGK